MKCWFLRNGAWGVFLPGIRNGTTSSGYGVIEEGLMLKYISFVDNGMVRIHPRLNGWFCRIFVGVSYSQRGEKTLFFHFRRLLFGRL